jgi:hypothetical protein
MHPALTGSYTRCGKRKHNQNPVSFATSSRELHSGVTFAI